MADLSDAHDPTGGEVAEGRGGPMPAGNYVLAMAKNDRKFTKANNGDWFLECEFEVKGAVGTGAAEGRRVWASFNLKNQSGQAQEIAWKDFNALCMACGKLPASVKNADDLLGIPFVSYIGIDKKDTTRNRISSYKPLNGAPAAAPQGAPARAAVPAQAATQGNVPAWRRARA